MNIKTKAKLVLAAPINDCSSALQPEAHTLYGTYWFYFVKELVIFFLLIYLKLCNVIC